MKNLSKSAVVAYLAISTMLAGCGGGSEAELIASAKRHLANRDSNSAVVQLKTALQKNANSGEARFLLGRALMEQGNLAAALAEFKRAQDLGFDPDQVLPKLARAMLATGQFKTIVDTFSDKKVGSPQAQAELHTALSIAQAGLGNADKMAAEWDKALIAVPKFAWALQTKARIAVAKGDLDQALTLVTESLESDAGNGDGWLLRGAVLFAGKKDEAAALESFQKALQDPLSAEAAHMSIISMHLTTGRINEARQQLELLQKAFPKSPQTAYARVQLAYQEKDFAKAKELLQPLLNAFPNSPRLLLFSGSTDKQRGALLLAEAELNKALKFAPNMADARKVLAETYLQLGQPQQVHLTLRPLVEGDRADGETLALLAGAYLQEGNVQQAEALYGRAAKLKPNDVSIRTALALTDLAKGKADIAFNTLQTIAADDTGVTADMALIAAHMRRGAVEAAIQAIDRLKKKQPANPTASYLRGRAERLRGNNEAARTAFEEALKLEPAHFGSTANLVSMEIAGQKLDAARQRLEAAVKLSPKNTAAHMLLTDVMARQGAKPEAIIAVLNDAIKANSLDPLPRVGLMAILADTKDFKGAQAAAQAAIAAFPDQPDVLYAAGNAQARAGDDQQAISSFSKLAGLQRASPLPHLRLADIYARRNDGPATALSLRRAFDAAPESPEVQKSLVAAMLRTKDPSVALNAARELQKRQPQRASGFLFEGDVHTLQKNWRLAGASYQQALGKIDPSERAPISVYLTHVSAGQQAEADRFAAGWIKSNPKDVSFQNRLGEVAMSRNDNATAERRFVDVLAIAPKNVSALNNLAWVLVKRGSKNAVEFAQKAAALAPDEAPVLDTLAQAHLINGQIGKAIEAETKALSLKPEHHPYRLSLAKLHIQAGDKAKAKAELDTLSALGAKFGAQGEVAELRKAL